MKNFLFALSTDVVSHPHVNFPKNIVVEHQGRYVSGSGIAWYPSDDNAATIIKDPKSFADLGRPKMIDDSASFRSTIFMMHLNGASWNPIPQDTEPYCKTVGKRDWLWMHQGSLDIQKLRKKNNQSKNFYEPVGNTDSELAFCIILNRIMRLKLKKLSEIGWDRIHDWFKELNELGSANFFLTDGKTLIVYRGLSGDDNIYKQRIKPPYEYINLSAPEAGFELDFRNEDDNLRTIYAFSTQAVSKSGFVEMKKGQMVIVKNGAIRWNSHAENKKPLVINVPPLDFKGAPSKIEMREQSFQMAANGVSLKIQPEDEECNIYINMLKHQDSRLMQVTHETTYTYSEPVEKSEHLFRLIPMYNRYQQVMEYSLDVSVGGPKIIYRDVFNNDVLQMTIEKPYKQLKIKSVAKVRIHKISSDDFSHPLRKTNIPATWMPWQRQMMQAFLMPQELPETQLRELSEYAMSFVERNDFNLFESLLDMNRTIYEDYQYKQGVTDINTSAFEVYVNRQGVCQDFANLLICMARLLNIPARYRVGYIYTGADYQNKIQSEATHAWAELYIPYVGWRGFDPTNGKLVDLDYIRVAAGRNFMDATPTSGTIYKGGGTETLRVDVKTEVLEG
jgi:transglutaminase-like putative cysteine protease/predicted glutamine amidotransferase